MTPRGTAVWRAAVCATALVPGAASRAWEESPERDCCLEGCCLRNCFGAKCSEQCLGGVCGEGCIFSMCFNPCGVNCMTMNTMYISTNDPQGLISLLNNKTNKSVTI